MRAPLGFGTSQAGKASSMAISLVYDGFEAASSGVTVDLDLTFAGQIVLFVLLFLVLRPLLFQPMLQLFEERERRIDGAKKDARQMYADADAKMAKYDEELLGVKRAAGEERDALRAEGLRREAVILAKVRTETNVMLEEGKAKIAKEAEGLRTELTATAQSLAREMASRVLGREVQP
jgi:F-type H+-transporting ATPase subunit b